MKRQFAVYFEIYGKKMKTTVEAFNYVDAGEKVKKRLQILKVEEVTATSQFDIDKAIEMLKDIFQK